MKKNLVMAGIGLALIALLAFSLTADATGKKSMDVSTRLSIERACEHLVYT